MYVAGAPFLLAPFTSGLMLNIDWFQPYSHTIYSVGVIYLVVVNLPRTLHYKPENLTIIGRIPGRTEPRHDLNSYLYPFVEDLLTIQSTLYLLIIRSCSLGNREMCSSVCKL